MVFNHNKVLSVLHLIRVRLGCTGGGRVGVGVGLKVMNDSIFHETSEGISSHKHNMKGYSLFFFFFLCRRGSVGNLQSKAPPRPPYYFPPPHLTALFVLPGQVYSFGSQRPYRLFIAWIQKSLHGSAPKCSRAARSKYSISPSFFFLFFFFAPHLFTSSLCSLSSLYS